MEWLRIKLAERLIRESTLDAILIEKEEDLAYFFHDTVVSGSLLIGRQESVFFVHLMDKDLYAGISGIQKIQCEAANINQIHTYLQKLKYKQVGFDALNTPFSRWKELQGYDCSWIEDSFFTEKQRSIKDDTEINKMKAAAQLGIEGYHKILDALVEGVTEKEIAKLLKAYWFQEGADDVSFTPIVAFGENAAYPHAILTDRKLKKGDVVLVDIGVKLDGYCSDMTRTVAFGKPDQKLEEAYEWVFQAHQAALNKIKAEVLCADIHQEVVKIFTEAGVIEHFFHGTGHGVGRNVHEFPYLSGRSVDARLASGMMVTIEPGLYFAGLGGIRIEDTILIQDQNYDKITNATISKKIFII